MPSFKNKQQERWAFATHQKFAKKWAAMTDQKSLPKKKKYQVGGTPDFGMLSPQQLALLNQSKSDNTSVQGFTANPQIAQKQNAAAANVVSQATKLADLHTILKRKAGIANSNANPNSFSSSDVQDKMRLFPNDPHSFIDDNINPLTMVGGMADDLGHSKSAGEFALNTVAPLTTGLLGFSPIDAVANNPFTQRVLNSELPNLTASLIKNKEWGDLGQLYAQTIGAEVAPIIKHIPVVNKMYKDLAYKYASQSGGAAFIDSKTISKISGNKFNPTGNYVGNMDGDIALPDRNMLKQYIYGDQKGFVPSEQVPQGLEKYTKRYGDMDVFNMRSYLGYNNPIHESEISKYFPEYNIKNSTGKSPVTSFTEGQNPIHPIDDVSGHLGWTEPNATGEKDFISQDIWKFTPEDYINRWKGTAQRGDKKFRYNSYLMGKQAKLMDNAGKPFITMSKNPVDFAPIEYKAGAPMNKLETEKFMKESDDLSQYLKILKDAPKYQFGGQDEQNAQDDNSFFSTLAQAAAQQKQSQQQDENNYGNYYGSNEDSNSTNFDDISSQIDDLRNLITQRTQGNYDPMVNDSHENDDFLSMLFSDDNNNDPIVFNESPSTETTDVSGGEDPSNNETTSYTHGPSAPTGFSGIFRNEGAATGQASTHSSSIGRGQMVKGTRMLMYKKLGVTDTAAAEQKFKTDPNFEGQVLNAYREDLGKSIPANITGKEREYRIAKGWYTGNTNYPDNQVPHPEAGNTLTAGEYAKRATKYQMGGLFTTNKQTFVDSTLNANRRLEWVQRLFNKNSPTMQVPGQPYRSTHLMSDDGNGYVFPQLQVVNGKLTDLGNSAEDYSRTNNTGIQFKTPEEGSWFATNGYKTGTNVQNSIDNKGNPFNNPKYPYQMGGVANTPEELYNGLNNSPLDHMMLNLPDTYNTVRGLDSGQPVYVKDAHGNSAILKGNKHTTRLRGKVFELKIKK